MLYFDQHWEWMSLCFARDFGLMEEVGELMPTLVQNEPKVQDHVL
jgi:hypothetical protein